MFSTNDCTSIAAFHTTNDRYSGNDRYNGIKSSDRFFHYSGRCLYLIQGKTEKYSKLSVSFVRQQKVFHQDDMAFSPFVSSRRFWLGRFVFASTVHPSPFFGNCRKHKSIMRAFAIKRLKWSLFKLVCICGVNYFPNFDVTWPGSWNCTLHINNLSTVIYQQSPCASS